MKALCLGFSFAFCFVAMLFAAPPVTAQTGAASRQTKILYLGETAVKVNVYEKPGDSVTFVAPHYNEQIARRAAAEAVERRGGRLVEIESTDARGNPARNLNFRLGGKTYTVDPNRIFTPNGRACGGFSFESERAVRKFAEAFLKLVLSPDGENNLREGERFIVAVHNNSDVDGKAASLRAVDLTASAYARNIGANRAAHASFAEQAAGVYLSNAETDADNFIFLSAPPSFIGYFAAQNFNVVAQKAARELQSKNCRVDDGSLSVFAGQAGISYICLEADAITGAPRQRRMIESVYGLLRQITAKSAGELDETPVAEQGERQEF
ncbi:MAG: hypothetical protein M3384_01955 [Acidobacteriota bacterium]|nr:hypothetical protein [Acidobacteriota bacterium]